MPEPFVGDIAPDFKLEGTGDKTYALSEYLGSPVVLVFYPGDNTLVCTLQLQSYSSDIKDFENLGATVLGISPQGVESHESFKTDSDLAMELLADPDKEVGRDYGILGPLGFYRRSVFVVDSDGRIAYAHRGMTGATFRPTEELLAAVTDAR